MNFDIEFEQEEDGRWIAEIPELPGINPIAFACHYEPVALN